MSEVTRFRLLPTRKRQFVRAVLEGGFLWSDFEWSESGKSFSLGPASSTGGNKYRLEKKGYDFYFEFMQRHESDTYGYLEYEPAGGPGKRRITSSTVSWDVLLANLAVWLGHLASELEAEAWLKTVESLGRFDVVDSELELRLGGGERESLIEWVGGWLEPKLLEIAGPQGREDEVKDKIDSLKSRIANVDSINLMEVVGLSVSLFVFLGAVVIDIGSMLTTLAASLVLTEKALKRIAESVSRSQADK